MENVRFQTHPIRGIADTAQAAGRFNGQSLLTTTALALSAGVAAADVTLSGDGRMGLFYNGEDVSLTSRARVTFTLTGETDTGLTFGGSFRADNATGAAAGTAGSVFISGAFGRLAFGDVDSAAEAATGDLFSVGLTSFGDNHEMQYISRLMNDINGTAALVLGLPATFTDFPYAYRVTGITTGLNMRPRALYTYSIDGLSVYASLAYSTSNRVTFTGTRTGPFGDPYVSDVRLAFPVDLSVLEASIGASYTIDGFMIAAGYENAQIKVDGDSTTLGHATLAASYSMEGITVKGIVGQAMNDLRDVVATNTQYGLGVSANFDAVTVNAYGRRDFFRTNHYGIGVAYDLGGGAAVRGGVQKSSGSDTQADFGVAFTF